MSTLAERLRFARQRAGLSQDQVAQQLSVTRSSISQWENGKTSPVSSRLLDLALMYNVNISWLANDQGPMQDTDGRELPIEEPGKLPPIEQGALYVFDHLSAADWPNPVVRHLGATVATIVPDVVVGNRAFGFSVTDDSMDPEIRTGDRVVIDPDVPPDPGDIVLAKLPNYPYAYLRKYRMVRGDRHPYLIELVPANSDWPTTIIEPDGDTRIIGTMVEHRRYRRNLRIR